LIVPFDLEQPNSAWQHKWGRGAFLCSWTGSEDGES